MTAHKFLLFTVAVLFLLWWALWSAWRQPRENVYPLFFVAYELQGSNGMRMIGRTQYVERFLDAETPGFIEADILSRWTNRGCTNCILTALTQYGFVTNPPGMKVNK